jgi:hypothetical protein
MQFHKDGLGANMPASHRGRFAFRPLTKTGRVQQSKLRLRKHRHAWLIVPEAYPRQEARWTDVLVGALRQRQSGNLGEAEEGFRDIIKSELLKVGYGGRAIANSPGKQQCQRYGCVASVTWVCPRC